MIAANFSSARAGWVVFVALWWFVLGAVYLTLPPSPDQFELDYMGWRMLDGAVPYRDFIDMNWPGVMWLHALSTAVFGNHLWSWRALDLVALAVSAAFLQDLVRRAAGAMAAALSLVLYPLFYAGLWQWFSGQPDMTAGQLLLVALWHHVNGYERQAWRWQIGSGIFLAAAMLNKPTLGILGPLLMVQGLAAGIAPRRVILHTAVAAGSSLCTLLAALLAVLLHGATLGEVGEALYTYNVWTQYLQTATSAELAASWAIVHAVSWHYLSAFALLGAGWLVWRTPGQLAATALPLLWVSGVLSFLVQRKGFAYHLAPCFIAIVGLAAAGLSLSLEAARARSRSWGGALAVLAALLVAAGGVAKLRGNYARLPEAFARSDYAVHLAQFQEGDGLSVAQAVELARQIERSVPAGETVFVLGSASSMNYLSRRAQPTRFYYAPVLIHASPPLPMADRWTDLFAGDLERAKPRWCLISTWARDEWLGGDSRGARLLREMLSTRYRKIGFVGGGWSSKPADYGMEIYERL